MNQLDFLYAVGRIKAIELGLLNAQAMEQILALDYKAALKSLYEKGWGQEGEPFERMLDNRLIQAWELLDSINPHKGCLDMLVIKNDFHNLKAALKAFVLKTRAEGLMLTPSVYEPEEIAEAVFAKDFGALPELLRDAAERAYAELVTNRDSQMADVIADRAALDAILRLAKKTGEETLIRWAEHFVASANIKTAARAALTKRGHDFLEEAIAPCASFDGNRLIEAAEEGFDGVLQYLRKETGYSEAAAALAQSMSAFEKWADDEAMKLLISEKSAVMGPGPLAAYYIAVETEVKALRIILSCKQNRVDDDMIRERMRLLYV